MHLPIVSNVDDDDRERLAKIVSALVDAGIEVDTIAALSLVPMIAVAWADRKIDAAERDAIIKAAIEHGLQEGSKSFQLLEQWLETAPDDALVTHWTDYIAALQETMPPAQHRKLGEEVIGCARKVANSAGGFLGIGKISDAEEAMLNRLKEPFK